MSNQGDAHGVLDVTIQVRELNHVSACLLAIDMTNYPNLRIEDINGNAAVSMRVQSDGMRSRVHSATEAVQVSRRMHKFRTIAYTYSFTL